MSERAKLAARKITLCIVTAIQQHFKSDKPVDDVFVSGILGACEEMIDAEFADPKAENAVLQRALKFFINEDPVSPGHLIYYPVRPDRILGSVVAVLRAEGHMTLAAEFESLHAAAKKLLGKKDEADHE